MDNNYWDQLIYTTAAVITEKLGYKMNSYKDQYLPWRRGLQAKIKTAQKLANYQAAERCDKERGA